LGEQSSGQQGGASQQCEEAKDLFREMCHS
jgi:hypothetical protein